VTLTELFAMLEDIWAQRPAVCPAHYPKPCDCDE